MSISYYDYAGAHLEADMARLRLDDEGLAKALGAHPASVKRWRSCRWGTRKLEMAMKALLAGLPPSDRHALDIRQRKGLTQLEMAEALGLREQSYQLWEYAPNLQPRLSQLALAAVEAGL